MELKSGVDGVLMELNWLDVMLVIVAMIQLGVVGFNVFVMLNVAKLVLDNLVMSSHMIVLIT
jgi:hypothetical protein